ncbi:MAG TPA: NAD(P)-binding protein, partial [Casimicrobiaceae bacterium]|nr:NAD(P)-binding protein [Casimicrobiaceae bacterium]
MSFQDCSSCYCVIGAGAAGVTAAKNLKALSIPFDLIEREDDVGGNWHDGKPCSSIYQSVHMISSKKFSEYTDFPIPRECPTYLRADQALAYLRSYARQFGVYEHAEFAFSTMLMSNQISIFVGLMLRTASQILDVREADIWVMDPRVEYVDEIEAMTDTQLQRVRGVDGVDWAVTYYKGLTVAHTRGGSLQQVILIGVDDATLTWVASKILLGSVENLKQPDAMIMDRAGYQFMWPRMRALKSSSDFRSRVNSDFGDRGLPCQPRIRWDSRSRTMIPVFGRG